MGCIKKTIASMQALIHSLKADGFARAANNDSLLVG